MTTVEILAKINEIFCNVLDNDDIVLAQETTADDVDGWDSLAHVKLMIAVESSFGVRFDIKEINSMANLGALVDTVARKLA